ncbi:hypothetical protein V8F06_013774 [Rhypophila decipiens]
MKTEDPSIMDSNACLAKTSFAGNLTCLCCVSITPYGAIDGIYGYLGQQLLFCVLIFIWKGTKKVTKSAFVLTLFIRPRYAWRAN